MKICDLRTPLGRLQQETKRLRDHWEETKQHWNDAASKEFEERYLAPLIPTMQQTMAAVYELAEIVAEAEKECGDHA